MEKKATLMRCSWRIVAWSILFVLSVGASSRADDPLGLLWPVPLEPGLSSNFCDYRDGRFHAGVDVRTFGREGVECLAAADGWVSRVRAASRGYGKALHLTLDSGLQVVYAHLAEFVPALEDTLWVEQVRAGRYTVDVALPEHRFRFRRGEVVAYSGSTGAVAPHLHFEVRSLGDEPLNPLTHGLVLPDSDPPYFPRVAFVPLSLDATVEGRCYPLELEPRKVGPGRYRLDDTLTFEGDVGVLATIVDKLNPRSGRLSPHAVHVWSDGSELAHASFERFRFDEVKHVDFALDMGALRGRGTELFTLYQRAGDPRERAAFLRGGRVSPAPSTRRVHDGRIVAFDAHGNRSEVAFNYTDSVVVRVKERRRDPANVRWRDSHLAVDLHRAYFHDAFAVVPVRDPRHLLTERGHGDDVARYDTVRVAAADLADTVRALERANGTDTATVWLSALRVFGAGSMRFAPLGLTLAYAEGSVFGDAVVYAVGEGDARAPRQRSLTLRSPAVRLGPVGLVLKRSVTLRLDVLRPTDQDAVYRSADASGPWSFLASTVDSAGVSASVDRPGVFAVIRDTAAPWIGDARVVVATSYADGDTTFEVHVPVDDEGSGFDEARTEVFVGGVKRIWRWDFAAKKIIVALRDESIIGPQPVRVVAFDRIGNSSKADATVTVEARASH
jgi:hypothetical protein